MRQTKEKDEEKAISLIETSKITGERLKKHGIFDFPTNSLVDYYNIIHSLCEAITCLEGYKFRGEGAHKELINHVLKNYESIKLIQEIRELRNKANYEGQQIEVSYLKINRVEIEKTIMHIKRNIDQLKD